MYNEDSKAVFIQKESFTLDESRNYECFIDLLADFVLRYEIGLEKSEK